MRRGQPAVGTPDCCLFWTRRGVLSTLHKGPQVPFRCCRKCPPQVLRVCSADHAWTSSQQRCWCISQLATKVPQHTNPPPPPPPPPLTAVHSLTSSAAQRQSRRCRGRQHFDRPQLHGGGLSCRDGSPYLITLFLNMAERRSNPLTYLVCNNQGKVPAGSKDC